MIQTNLTLAIRRCSSAFLNSRNVSFNLSSKSTRSVLLQRTSSTGSLVQHYSDMTNTPTADLPRLPVPKVEETTKKFLKTVAPLLNNEEFHQTKQIVEQFQKECEPLQELLLKRAQTEENWLSRWWLDKTYLEWRLNLPIYYNPALLFPRQSYRDFDGQLQFAAHFIHGALQYRTFIDENQIPIDRFGNDPLCMDQYRKLFATCRIPAAKIDRLHQYEKTNHRHVAIFYRNNLYRLPVYDEHGEKFSAQTIYNHLKQFDHIRQSPNVQTTLIGHLTADERQLWAPIYEKLTSIPENKQFFETINDSLMVVCLDENYQTLNQKDPQTLMGLNFLHGGGTKYNTANRWFDKTIQVIFGPDGFAGLNYEHSLAEGGMVTALVDFILNHCKKSESLNSSNQKTSALTQCNIVVPKEFENDLVESQKRVDKFIENCDLIVHKYTDYGKKFAKEKKLSIDAMIQVALQVAFYRMHGKCGATYESGSLRRYHLGRTETIRSCTLEALKFAQAMAEEHHQTSNESKYQLFINAIQAHRQYTNDALQAKGIDRHLLGLRLTAIENNYPRPAFYDHLSYKRAMHFVLSTSQVGAKNDCVMVYGPAVDDGYGCCYNPRDDSINYMVTAFTVNNAGTNVKEFSKHFNRSLTDIRKLIEQNTPATTTKAKL